MGSASSITASRPGSTPGQNLPYIAYFYFEPQASGLFLFESTKRIARTFSEVKGKKIGQVAAVSGGGLMIHGQGGFIEVHRSRWDGGKKIAAAEAGLEVGAILGG